MRYKKLIIVGITILVIGFLLGGLFVTKNTINIESVNVGEAIFKYAGNNISHTLSHQELIVIENIFNGKMLYKDNPSCGFTENVCVRFNGSQTFCFACDTCPIIYWKEGNKYFKISEEEKQQLYELLGEYGFHFPCV